VWGGRCNFWWGYLFLDFLARSKKIPLGGIWQGIWASGAGAAANENIANFFRVPNSRNNVPPSQNSNGRVQEVDNEGNPINIDINNNNSIINNIRDELNANHPITNALLIHAVQNIIRRTLNIIKRAPK